MTPTSPLSVFFYTPNIVYLVWGLVTFVQFCFLLPVIFGTFSTTILPQSKFKLGINTSRKGRMTFSKYGYNAILWQSVLVGMLVNLFTLTGVFWMHGAVVLAPLGFQWSITLASLILTLGFNFFLVWYIGVVAWRRPIQRFRGVAYYLPASAHGADEYLFLFLLHLLSLFIFGFCDLGSVFIGVEIASFIFILVTGAPVMSVVSGRPVVRVNTLEVRVSEAALTYLWTGLLSALPFLAGILFIYYDMGTLSFDYLLPLLVWDGTLSSDFFVNGPHLFARWGSFLILISLLIKLGVAPLHSWLVRVYDGAYGHTVYLLATVSKFFYMAVLIRFVLPLLPVGGGGSQPSLFFIFIGLCSVTVACYWGLQELRLTNLLAYSGILNTGISLMAFGLPQPFLGPFIAFFLLWIYLFLLAFFITLIVRSGSLGPDGLLRARVAFRAFIGLSPLFRLFFALVIFGLIGIPPLLGFFPKLILLVAYILNLPPVLGFWFGLVVVASSIMYLRLAAGVLVPLFTSFSSWSTFMYGLLYDTLTWKLAWMVGALLIIVVYPGTTLAFIGILVFCIINPRTGGTTGNFEHIEDYIDIEGCLNFALSCDLLAGWGGGGIF